MRQIMKESAVRRTVSLAGCPPSDTYSLWTKEVGASTIPNEDDGSMSRSSIRKTKPARTYYCE